MHSTQIKKDTGGKKEKKKKGTINSIGISEFYPPNTHDTCNQ